MEDMAGASRARSAPVSPAASAGSLLQQPPREAAPEVFLVREAVRRWLRQAAEPLRGLNYGAVLVNWRLGEETGHVK